MDFKKVFEIKVNKMLLPENRVQEAKNLYPGQGIGEIRAGLQKGLKKRLITMGIVALLVLIAMVVKDCSSRREGLDFVRNPMNQGSSSLGLTLSLGESRVDYQLLLNSQQLDDEGIDRIQQRAEEALDSYILGENPDLLHVSKKLNLPEEIELMGERLIVSWSSDRVDIVDTKGNVKNEDVDMNTTVTLRGKIVYGQEFRLYERLITIIPKQLTEEEKRIEEAFQQIQKLEEESNESDFSVPGEIDGVKVENTEKPVNYLLVGLFFLILIPVIGYFSYFEQIAEKRKAKIEEGLLDYKDFIRKLNLLLSAGMSVRLAWKKLCKDQAESGKDSLLSEALRVSLRELDSGIREQICYQRFGERMGSRPYERLAEILSQQSQKGVSHVSCVLEQELKDVCEDEKEELRVKAEKAGTVLLLPIIGLLAMVFLIIMVPAFSGISM